MDYATFREIFIGNKPPTLMNVPLSYWYNNYFKWYEKKELEKVFQSIAEDGTEWTLNNIFKRIKEYYSSLIHKELEKAADILVDFPEWKDATKFPQTKKPLPVKRAWELKLKEK